MKKYLLEEEISEIKDNEWVILSTCSENIPHSIILIPSRIENNRMIFSRIRMTTTMNNIIKNNNSYIDVYIKNNNEKQYKINCTCEIYTDGNLYNEIKKYEEENNLPADEKVSAIIIANYQNIEITHG